MAIDALAWRHSVCVRERESIGGVIELCIQPRVHAVTLLACSRKLTRRVVRILRLLIVPGVAAVTLRRQSLKLSRRSALVTGFAVDCRVCPNQWKPVLMFSNLLKGNPPALHAMTALAIRAELSTVDVCVAIRALCPNVREHQLRVALRTGNILMHPSQWIGSLVVIEFRHAADRFPTRLRVAVLARDRQRAMWTSAGHCLSRRGRWQREQNPDRQMCDKSQCLSSLAGAKSTPKTLLTVD